VERPLSYDGLIEFLKDLRLFFMPLDVWLLMLNAAPKIDFG